MARHQFAVIALAALALASSFSMLLEVVAAYSKNTETFGVAAFETRFELLRKSMPPHPVFGYVSDNPGADVTSQGEFYLTQYTLAPAIVKASTEEGLVVGNFHTKDPDRALLQSKNLILYRDFGNDVHVYNNTTRIPR